VHRFLLCPWPAPLSRTLGAILHTYSTKGDNILTTITSLTATEIAQKIKAREMSASEVVEAHVRRIEEVNPRLNAVVIPLFEQARQQAKDADAAQRIGNALGLLHGVPVTIKEQFLVKDTATSFGLLHQKNRNTAKLTRGRS